MKISDVIARWSNRNATRDPILKDDVINKMVDNLTLLLELDAKDDVLIIEFTSKGIFISEDT